MPPSPLTRPVPHHHRLLKWVTDIAKAVKYLHGTCYIDGDGRKVVGIMHRDLKPDNCLVSSNWGIKVCDFGEARAAVDEDEKTLTVVGTPLYVAPEIVKGDMVSTRCEELDDVPLLTAMGGRKARSEPVALRDGRVKSAS